MQLLTAIAIGALFGVGIFQLLRRNVIRVALGFIILSNAVNLFLLSMGAYDGRGGALRDGQWSAQRCAAAGAGVDGHRHQHGRAGFHSGRAARDRHSLSDQRCG